MAWKAETTRGAAGRAAPGHGAAAAAATERCSEEETKRDLLTSSKAEAMVAGSRRGLGLQRCTGADRKRRTERTHRERRVSTRRLHPTERYTLARPLHAAPLELSRGRRTAHQEHRPPSSAPPRPTHQAPPTHGDA
jgi:hypothetical protein